jgi:hypothetical protein
VFCAAIGLKSGGFKQKRNFEKRISNIELKTSVYSIKTTEQHAAHSPEQRKPIPSLVNLQ